MQNGNFALTVYQVLLTIAIDNSRGNQPLRLGVIFNLKDQPIVCHASRNAGRIL